jgi:hypothetical protein
MGSRKISCALVLLFVFHVQADFGIPGYSFRNFDMTANQTAGSGKNFLDVFLLVINSTFCT